MFLTTVVFGVVILVSNTALEPWSFLRNLLFLLGAVFGLIAIVYRGQVNLLEAVLFLIYYGTYIGLVLVEEAKARRQLTHTPFQGKSSCGLPHKTSVSSLLYPTVFDTAMGKDAGEFFLLHIRHEDPYLNL